MHLLHALFIFFKKIKNKIDILCNDYIKYTEEEKVRIMCVCDV